MREKHRIGYNRAQSVREWIEPFGIMDGHMHIYSSLFVINAKEGDC